MLDDGAIGRGDPSVRHHFRDSVSDTMRITDLAAPRKIPPGTGWRKFVYSVSFHKINPGESPRERHYRNLQGRIRRHIRRQYVITVVSGKGGVGVTTMAACIGGVFRECRPENVIAIDAVPSFGTLADRIDESPPGDYAAIINDTDVQGYADIREHLGQNTVGLDVLAGNRTSDQPRPLVPAMFSAVLSRLRRTHTVIVIDTSPDLEHDVMKAVLQSTDTLVFVSGITADRSRPVLRAVDYLRAQGYHELVSRSTVILNHTDSITDKDALAYLGLAGRFNRKLRFESYSPVEIVEIGHRYATPRASQLDDAAREVFLDAVTTIRNYTTPSGQHGIDAMQNGRFARNVIERAEGFRDTRVVAQKRAGQPVSVQDLQIITATDIDAAIRSVCSDNRDMAAIVW